MIINLRTTKTNYIIVAYRSVARQRWRNNETTAVAKQRPARNNRSTVENGIFYIWSAPRLYHATDRVQFNAIRGLYLAVVKLTTVQITELPL
jgi:hypothetical protein